MEARKITILNSEGLHLRTAAKVVRCSQQFRSRVLLCQGCRQADTCSILQLLSLGAAKGTELEIKADGPDENAAVKVISELFADGAGI